MIGYPASAYGQPVLLEHFKKYAHDTLTPMEQDNDSTQAVTKVILAKLDDELFSIEKVAREMSTSVRTFQK